MMPTSVDVITKTYSIRLQDKMSDYGECTAEDCLIKVGSHQCEQQRRDTLLHEVMHAVEHELNVQVSEKAIRVLATGLLAVLRQNPKLVAYLVAR